MCAYIAFLHTEAEPTNSTLLTSLTYQPGTHTYYSEIKRLKYEEASLICPDSLNIVEGSGRGGEGEGVSRSGGGGGSVLLEGEAEREGERNAQVCVGVGVDVCKCE